MLRLKFVGKGCSTYGELILGEINRFRTHHDLTAFVVDNTNWNEVELINRKNIEVIINGQSVFAEYYHQSIGNVIGASLIFHATG